MCEGEGHVKPEAGTGLRSHETRNAQEKLKEAKDRISLKAAGGSTYSPTHTLTSRFRSLGPREEFSVVLSHYICVYDGSLGNREMLSLYFDGNFLQIPVCKEN